MIPPRQFVSHVIDPVLDRLAEVEPRMRSRAAQRLLLGTAIKESGLRELVQRGGGSARSMFQIEPATFEDIYGRYIAHRHDIRDAVNSFVFRRLVPTDGWRPVQPIVDQLSGNQHLACAIARIKFWMAPEPLPSPDDIDGLGAYWKTHYNTAGGAGAAEGWAEAFRENVPWVK